MRNIYKPKVNSGGVKNLKLKRVSLIIVGIFCYALLIIGGTYAYYALTASNNSIAGTAGEADLSLEVVNQHPNNEEYLVPQLEKGLATAISSNYNCVDDNNNTVCQVYSIKITNTGTATVKVNGTITFGNIDKMPNLKWRLIQDKNTYGNYSSHYASLDDARFDSNLTLRKGASKTYYMVIWIDEVDENQSDTGKYNATIDFSSSNGTGVTSTVGEFNYMKNMGWNSSDYFRSAEYKEKIKTVSFVDYIDTNNAVVQWDMSDLGDNSIVAWLNNNAESGYYDLYIGSKEEIYAKDLNNFFAGMKYLDEISFSNLNTIMTTNMANMFWGVGLKSLDLGNKFNTKNVTDMARMFWGIVSTNINLGDKFDTRNVTNMMQMFSSDSNLVNLDLGDKFDTSNVTNMGGMFNIVGTNVNNFTLNLGNKFDTSNVTNVASMFYAIYPSKIDLTQFNFAKITSYTNFIATKQTTVIYVKSEADKNWILDKNFSGVSSDNVIVKK